MEDLKNIIKDGATGYEALYKAENFKNKILEKFVSLRKRGFFKLNPSVSLIYSRTTFRYPDLEKIGKHLVKESKVFSYTSYEEKIEDEKKKLISRLGYLEFKKHLPSEKMEKKEDIDEFIRFLDDKYKEWEDSRGEKR